MSLYRPAKSPYYHYDFTIKGERFSGSTRVADKATARQVEAAARRDAAMPAPKGKPSITLDEAAGLYAEYAAALPSWPDTKRILGTMMAEIGGAKRLSDVSQLDLIRAVQKRRYGRANSSVNREIVVWRAVWRYADAARFDVGDMPAWGKLMLTVAEKAARTLSDAEEARLFEALRPDLHDFARFALASGWRVSEVRALTWRDVDLASRTARTRIKGGNVIVRPLSATMLALIASQPRVAVQVFTYIAQASRAAHVDRQRRKRSHRVRGERYPLSENGWGKPWRAALAAAGIDAMTFHGLRHTRATRMMQTTGNLLLTGRALGHRSLKTTARYAHVNADDVRDGLDASEIRADHRTITEPYRKPFAANGE